MTTIVLGGDCVTTSVLAIAAGWPPPTVGERDRSPVVVEADPSGGSLASWLDTPLSPSLSSVVTALRQAGSPEMSRSVGSAHRSIVTSMIRRSPSGVLFIPAPFRVREARGAVAEADAALFPAIADDDELVALVDVGRLDPVSMPGVVRSAETCLVTHRQDSSSASAATVRLERLAETVAALVDAGRRVGLVLVGEEPFALDEIVEFVAPNDSSWVLPVDPLAATVLAGRTGVSARRLARLPLMRSAARIAADLHERVVSPAGEAIGTDRPVEQREEAG